MADCEDADAGIQGSELPITVDAEVKAEAESVLPMKYCRSRRRKRVFQVQDMLHQASTIPTKVGRRHGAFMNWFLCPKRWKCIKDALIITRN
ncbi:hypothetical protein R1flu_004339 [Riccia fluitans]|uniref:Uncharacterized protein n=1 Tax=Riccia fluitans TaxID=41844 RepID=A0ABD1YQT2_9MARC